MAKLLSQRDAVAGGAPWRLLLGLTSINFFANLDRYGFAVVMQPIKVSLHATDGEMGVLSGLAFVVCYVIVGIPLAGVVDRGARRTVLLVCLGAWSIACTLCGVATTFWQMALFRGGLGMAEAGATPASLSMIADTYPPDRRHQAVSLFQFGAAAAPILGVPVLAGLTAVFSWRVAIAAAGAAGLALCLILSWSLEEPERGRYDAAVATPAHAATFWKNLREILSNKGLVLHILSHTAITGGTGIMLVWVGAYSMRNIGLTITQVGGFFSIASLIMMAGLLIGGWICGHLVRKYRNDRVIAAFSALVALLTMAPYAAMLMSSSLPVFLAGLILSNLIFVSRTPPAMTLAADIGPAHARGLTTSVLLAVASLLGSGFAPAVTGWVSDHLAPSLGEAEALRMALLYTVMPCMFAGAVLGLLSMFFIGQRAGRAEDAAAVRIPSEGSLARTISSAAVRPALAVDDQDRAG